MLPKKRRMQRKEFAILLKTVRRYLSPHLSLFVSKNPANEPYFDTKFAFSASKKVAKTAVLRNKLRRMGYSAIRDVINRISPGYMCLFSYKNDPKNVEFSVLKNEVEKLLSDAGVLI